MNFLHVCLLAAPASKVVLMGVALILAADMYSNVGLSTCMAE